MFGIGLGELIILGLVGIIILGPQRLVQTAKTLGATIGKLKREWSDREEVP